MLAFVNLFDLGRKNVTNRFQQPLMIRTSVPTPELRSQPRKYHASGDPLDALGHSSFHQLFHFLITEPFL